MTRKISISFVAICVVLVAPGTAVKDNFTIHCQVDISGVAADEPLYEVGPVRLAFRMAGRTKELEQYPVPSLYPEDYLSRFFSPTYL